MNFETRQKIRQSRLLRPFYKIRQWGLLKKDHTGFIREYLEFEMHVCDYCNLNCIGCTHFSPLVKPGEDKFIDLDRFQKDIERINFLFGERFKSIHFMGGEPLLNPDLAKIIKITRNISKGVNIEIWTNGTLIFKQDEELWKTCKECKADIRITNYPINFNYEKAKEYLESFGLDVRLSDVNRKVMFKYPLTLKGNNNIKKEFKHCPIGNKCINLRDGRFYTCPIVPNIRFFNEYFGNRIETRENDSIDIYEANSANEIFEFLAKPVQMCRYCDLFNIQKGIEWRPSKKELSEWV